LVSTVDESELWLLVGRDFDVLQRLVQRVTVMGTFIVSASQNNDWLEGFTSWYDTDAHRVENSRSILVRNGCPRFSKLFEDARHSVKREIKMFRLSKLVEAGYETDEALTMLSSIPQRD
jgi:hypothetical protein